MVKLDRIEHTVTIPEGVTATLSEDGVRPLPGRKARSPAPSESDVVQLFQDGAGLIVRVDLLDASSEPSQAPGTLISTTWSRA